MALQVDLMADIVSILLVEYVGTLLAIAMISALIVVLIKLKLAMVSTMIVQVPLQEQTEKQEMSLKAFLIQ